jgi:Domain of unknown function (DUF4124)
MTLRLFFAAILVFGFFLIPPYVSSEEIYRWTDEKGTTHFTDDASTIPEKYRREAEEKKVTGEVAKEEAAEEEKIIKELGKSGEGEDRVKKYLEKTDQKVEAKRKIEKKISELEDEMKLSEERLKWIEEYERENYYYYMPYRNSRTGRLAPVASPYYDEKVRLEQRIASIKSEIKALQEKVSGILKNLQ